MDFTNRSASPHQTVEPQMHSTQNDINIKRPNRTNGNGDKNKWARVGLFGCFIAFVVLIIAVIVVIASYNNQPKAQSTYVMPSKLQAVFLNTGQVYFGYIKNLNKDYLVLTDIYYLQTSSTGTTSSTTSASSNVTLVKLGCEIHRPYDQMVINRSSVTFWENLHASGQVAQAVAKYQSQNPHHTCANQGSSASTTSGGTAQPATNSSSSSTSTTAGKP